MHKKALYIIALLTAPLCGALVAVMAGDAVFSIWDVPVALFSLLLVFAWYRLDTDSYGLKRHIWGNCAFVTITVIALPIYLFKTRGFLKGLGGSLFFFALNIAWTVLEALGSGTVFLIESLNS